MRDLPARVITGLTATPQRRDGHDPIVNMQCGPVRHTLKHAEQIETATRRVLVTRDSQFDPAGLPVDPGIQEILSAVAADATRTRRIATDAATELSEGRYPLVLTERREHLDAIAELVASETERIVVLHGGMGVRARRHADEMLATDGPRVVLATGRYIGEGFDDPRLDTLMLAMPIAWKGTMTQYAGRLHRHHDAKHEVRIIDYVDLAVPVLRRMYAKRQHAYTSLGYATG
jgi:superfamily II DNA or RNA helicase